MPLCAACCVTKGFNKYGRLLQSSLQQGDHGDTDLRVVSRYLCRFHGGQRHLPRPVCKECFRTGKKPVDLGGEPETLLYAARNCTLPCSSGADEVYAFRAAGSELRVT
jgi:hypothetical protein